VCDTALAIAEYVTAIDVVDPVTVVVPGEFGVVNCVAVPKVKTAASEVDVADVPFFSFVTTTV
jgi:hypothetical protein